MLDRLEVLYAGARPMHRVLSFWTVTGALVHAVVPALHGAQTPFGPAALWLWLLPLTALALDLLVAPAPLARRQPASAAGPAGRRRRPAAAPARLAISRRERPRLASASPPVQPVRRAG
jgi:hypothetical protein